MYDLLQWKWCSGHIFSTIYPTTVIFLGVKANTPNATRARASASIFECELLFLIQSKSYEVENSTLLMELEPTTPRLHGKYSNRWATGMWHFPIDGLRYWLWRFLDIFLFVRLTHQMQGARPCPFFSIFPFTSVFFFLNTTSYFNYLFLKPPINSFFKERKRSVFTK